MNSKFLCFAAAFSMLFAVSARGGQIAADPSDFEVFSDGGVGGESLTDMGVGDTGSGSPNLGRRSVVRFSLAGLSGQSVQSAILNLYIIESRKDQSPAPGVITSSPPFINPGLGDTQVIHISDYVLPNGGAYSSASLGNNPGTLIAAGAQPAARQVSIDVKAAMQQAINSGFSFVTFRLQTATETDGDNNNDLWFFASGDATDPAQRPFIEYAAVPEPAGILFLAIGAAAMGLRRGRGHASK